MTSSFLETRDAIVNTIGDAPIGSRDHVRAVTEATILRRIRQLLNRTCGMRGPELYFYLRFTDRIFESGNKTDAIEALQTYFVSHSIPAADYQKIIADLRNYVVTYFPQQMDPMAFLFYLQFDSRSRDFLGPGW